MIFRTTFASRSMACIAAVWVATLLSACGSSVKLDEVPVSEAKGTQVTSAPASTPDNTTTGVVQRNVEPVKVDQAGLDKAGPQDVSKLILFDYDSSVIKAEYQNMLEAHARFLREVKTRKIAIEGHTDESGGREYNLALGQKRAEAVRRALALLGVTDVQMEAVSFGEEKPVDSARNEAAYSRNRRAELSYR